MAEKISIIIPCFDEEEVILLTLSRLRKMVSAVDWMHELVFVNDGSRDSTLSLLKKIQNENPGVRIISFSRNFGHQAAVSAGLEYASGDAAVIIDADLQDPPELIPEMVKIWAGGEADIVYGKRIQRHGETLFKKLSASVFYRMLNFLSDTPIPRDSGDFRLIDRKVINAFNSLPERNKFIRGLIPWLGYKAVPLEYNRDPRLAGKTKYPLPKMLKLAADGSVSFSRKPLQLATTMGILNLAVSLFLVIYVFVAYFSRQISVVPGWASTVIIIIFFSGVQLLILGILGTYIGRIFDEVKNRPEYIVDEILE